MVRVLAKSLRVAVIELGPVPKEFVIEVAAGNLFLEGFHPDRPWCVYCGYDRVPFMTEVETHTPKLGLVSYHDSDELWPSDEWVYSL